MSLLDIVAALMIFIVTLILIITQPRRLSIGTSASIGAVIALLLGIVSWTDVIIVTNIVWNATLTFIALVMISLILDEIGYFEWASLHMTRLAKGSGVKMFSFLILLGALVSALFANDGAVLIMTPIVLAMMRTLMFPNHTILPFAMASGFIADTASLPFVISNLTNIISADFFQLGFLQYALVMLMPNIISIFASLVVLYVYFNRSIPKTYDETMVQTPMSAIQHKTLFTITWYCIAFLIVGYICSEMFSIPISLITSLAALFLLICGSYFRVIHVPTVIKNAPWAIIFFSIGMYVIVYGLKNVGLTTIITSVITLFIKKGSFLATIGTGFLAAFLSSIMNNLPTIMINSIALKDIYATEIAQQLTIYANIIGTNLGPKITPIGSLATLIWLHVLRRDGIYISWAYYFKIGLILTIPTLTVTLISLIIWGHIIL